MADELPQDLWTLLVRSLQNLASSPSDQERYLKGLGAFPNVDELALEFDDAFVPLDYRWEVFGLGALAIASIRDVSQHLDRMSGTRNESLWTVDALVHSSEWNEVRRLAHRALELVDRNPPVE